MKRYLTYWDHEIVYKNTMKLGVNLGLVWKRSE